MVIAFLANRGSDRDWIKIKGTIKDGVKREVGVDGVEFEECVEHVCNSCNKFEEFVEEYNESCLRFTYGSASCILKNSTVLKRPYGWCEFRKR